MITQINTRDSIRNWPALLPCFWEQPFGKGQTINWKPRNFFNSLSNIVLLKTKNRISKPI